MARIVKVETSATSPRPYEVRWSWYDTAGKRHFKKARYRTEREAKAKKREVEDAVASANLPDYAGGKQSLAFWGERWLAERETLTKPSTARGYRAIWTASVRPAFGDRRIGSITAGDVQDWVTSLLRDNKAPATIKHHAWVLGQVFAYAVRARAITYNPARDVRLPTNRSTGRLDYAPHFLTAREIDGLARHLTEAYPEAPWGALVRFMAWTGLRTGEVAGLNVGDVDLASATPSITVTRTRSFRGGVWTEHTPKSGKARTVPLLPSALTAVRDVLAMHPDRDNDNAPLWPGTRPGASTGPRTAGRFAAATGSGRLDWSHPWEAGTFLKRRFRPATLALGLGTPRLHDLRHTFASLAASQGIPSAQVAAWLGHADDIITRQIYTHLFAEDSTRHAERLAALDLATSTATAPSRRNHLRAVQ